jgi:1-acyl-sn-glycerol-3-phosphate acyltransferase
MQGKPSHAELESGGSSLDPGSCRTPGSASGLWALVNRALFWLFQQSVLLLLRLYFGYRVEGRVPANGPCIVIANHTSFLDALLLGGVTQRRIRFVMTDMFANIRGLRWFLRWNQVLLVKENARSSRQLFQEVEDTLAEGRPIGIFPEGGISHDGQLQELQAGALWIALRAGVPIVPVGISGAFAALPRHRRLPRPATIVCRVGEPIEVSALLDPKLPPREARQLAAERLRAALAELICP